MQTYTIGDLARCFGVTLRTLRFYEDRGLVSPARAGSTRVYSEQDRRTFALILEAKRLGFSLSEIKAMRLHEAEQLNLSVDQVESQLRHMETQKVEIDQAIASLRSRFVALAA